MLWGGAMGRFKLVLLPPYEGVDLWGGVAGLPFMFQTMEVLY